VEISNLNNPHPAIEKERYFTPDVLRGLAICGMLLVNIYAYAFPGWEGTSAEEYVVSIYDNIALMFTGVFLGGKFLTIFSVLFGLGLALQFDRANKGDRNIKRTFIRRLIVLFFIGILHGLLLFSADILAFYAIMGLLAYLFRNSSDKTLITAIVACVIISIIIISSILMRYPELTGRSEPNWGRLAEQRGTELNAAHENSDLEKSLIQNDLRLRLYEFMANDKEIYSSGVFGEIVLHRAVQFYIVGMPLRLALVTWRCLPLFLLGILFFRSGIFLDKPENRKKYRYLFGFGFAAGMGLQTISFLGFSNIGANPILTVMVISGMILGFPVLGLAYAGGISLLCLKDKFVPMLRPLAAAGRMALSNYVGQSIICGFIFNSYGLGLYGELNPLATIIIAIMLLIFQIAFSVFWLNRFQFGPLEWIWKSLTYMKKPGFIKSRSAVSTAELEVKNEYR
jgi:uncharacterized protein